jgi:hypothetical protein
MSTKVDQLRAALKADPNKVKDLSDWLKALMTDAGVTTLTLDEAQEFFQWVANASTGPNLGLVNFTQT